MPESVQSPAVPTGGDAADTPFVAVGVSDLKVAARSDGVGALKTFALGSCIGLTAYDPGLRVGGMLHFMLPSAGEAADAERNPAMYAASGIPALLEALERRGARGDRLVLVAAGAAEVMAHGRAFAIGNRNRTALRQVLWRIGLTLAAEDTGGNQARTMTLDLTSGAVTVKGRGKDSLLWQP